MCQKQNDLQVPVAHRINKRGLISIQNFLCELVHPVLHHPEACVCSIAKTSQHLDIQSSLGIGISVNIIDNIVTNHVRNRLHNHAINLLISLQVIFTKAFLLSSLFGIRSLAGLVEKRMTISISHFSISTNLLIWGDKSWVNRVHPPHCVRDVATTSTSNFTAAGKLQTLRNGDKSNNPSDNIDAWS